MIEDDVFPLARQRLAPTEEDREKMRIATGKRQMDSTKGASAIIPPPMSVGELIRMPDRQQEYVVEGMHPAAANVINVAYPKSHKTNAVLDLAVTAVSANPHLHFFHVPRQHRIGLVLMEDNEHRIRRRLRRICQGYGFDLSELDGLLHLWFRPKLKLINRQAVDELTRYAESLHLDGLWIDSWVYVSTGSSNEDDVVAPQLDNLRSMRDRMPELLTGLTLHAKKQRGASDSGDLITDHIRGSGHFGAWYDSAFCFTRSSERSPVTVRAEHRDDESPEPFAFVVDDEVPANPKTRQRASGWMRLRYVDEPPAMVIEDAAVKARIPDVIRVLRKEPDISKARLRKRVGGNAACAIAAFESLVASGDAEYEEPTGKGKAGKCRLKNQPRPTASEPRPGRSSATTSHPLNGGRGAEHVDVAPSSRDAVDEHFSEEEFEHVGWV